MRPPARNHPGAELLAAQPARPVVAHLGMHTLLRVWHQRRRAQPHLVIELLRNRHDGLLLARRIAGKTHLHGLQLTDATVAHELRRVSKLRRRALLASDLKDTSRSVHGVAERTPFRNRQRGGLLQIEVLARFDRIDRDERVPVIWRADDDGVHVLVRQQLAIVRICRHAVVRFAGLLRVLLVDQRLRILHAFAVQIAHRHDSRDVVPPDARQVMTAGDAPGAYRTNVDAIARREGPEHRRRDDGGKSADAGDAAIAFPAAVMKLAAGVTTSTIYSS